MPIGTLFTVRFIHLHILTQGLVRKSKLCLTLIYASTNNQWKPGFVDIVH